METAGYLASLGTSLLFSFGSICFTLAGRQLGSAVVNRVRLIVAVIAILVLHTVAYGTPYPTDAEPFRFFFLGISGFIGYVLGDAMLFQAFVMIGPRLSTLMMALAPVMTVILAWLFLGENLGAQDLLGIALTISGVVWVVSDSHASNQSSQVESGTRQYWIGLAFGFGGAVGQAVGLILSKRGLVDNFPALSGNAIRLSVALVCIWAFTIVSGQFMHSFRVIQAKPHALKFLVAGALLGPVFAVTLGLFSIQNIPAGIASTLQSLMPIFLIPISYFIFQERVTQRAIIGTVIALVGTAILFL
jgi:drug/metabolite transporter (DMT)-like permease